jgi:hypothetical protein
MKLSEILRAGKNAIETRGWCQGDELAIHGPPNGPCCAATAIGPYEDDPFDFRAVNLLRQAAGIGGDMGLATWNDAPERTKADVLAAYDKAIAAAEAQEQA